MTPTIYILKLAICSTLAAMACYIAWFYLCEWMRISIARENEYDKMYAKIKRDIYYFMRTPENRLKLRLELIELKRLKYKNAEKTGILKQEFDWHYRSLNAKERTEFKKAI